MDTPEQRSIARFLREQESVAERIAYICSGDRGPQPPRVDIKVRVKPPVIDLMEYHQRKMYDDDYRVWRLEDFPVTFWEGNNGKDAT